MTTTLRIGAAIGAAIALGTTSADAAPPTATSSSAGFELRALPSGDHSEALLAMSRPCNCVTPGPNTLVINPYDPDFPDPNDPSNPDRYIRGTTGPGGGSMLSYWDAAGVDRMDIDTVCIQPGDYRSWGVMAIRRPATNGNTKVINPPDSATPRPHPATPSHDLRRAHVRTRRPVMTD